MLSGRCSALRAPGAGRGAGEKRSLWGGGGNQLLGFLLRHESTAGEGRTKGHSRVCASLLLWAEARLFTGGCAPIEERGWRRRGGCRCPAWDVCVPGGVGMCLGCAGALRAQLWSGDKGRVDLGVLRREHKQRSLKFSAFVQRFASGFNELECFVFERFKQKEMFRWVRETHRGVGIALLHLSPRSAQSCRPPQAPGRC